MSMYALFLLIAVAAFGLWYGLSRLFERMDKDKHPDEEAAEEKKENEPTERQDE